MALRNIYNNSGTSNLEELRFLNLTLDGTASIGNLVANNTTLSNLFLTDINVDDAQIDHLYATTDATIGNNIFTGTSGNVGIGTANPVTSFQVGNVFGVDKNTGSFYMANVSAPNIMQQVFSTTGIQIMTASGLTGGGGAIELYPSAGSFVTSMVLTGEQIRVRSSSGTTYMTIRSNTNPSGISLISNFRATSTLNSMGALVISNTCASINMSTSSLDALAVSGGSLFYNNVSAQGLLLTNSSITNLLATSATLPNITITNSTFSNLTATNITSTNLINTNANITNETVSSHFGTNVNVSNNTLTNILNTNETTQNLIVSNGLKAIFNSNTVGTLYTTGGNVGINQTQPGFTLDVSGTGRISSSFTTASLNSTNITSTNAVFTNSSISSLIPTNLNTTNVSATNIVNTNISSSNSILTNINNNTSTIQNLLNTNGLKAIFNSNTVGTLYTTGGNVGINQTQPGFTLDVSGTGRITTSLTTASLNSTNITSTNAVFTNSSISSLISSNTLSTNNTLTNLLNTNSTLTNSIITNASISNLNVSGQTISNSNLTNATIQNLFTSNQTGTNILVSNATATNLVGTNSILTNLVNTTHSTGSQNVSGSITALGSIHTIGSIFISGGNVGINTTGPSKNLTVSGDILASLTVSTGTLCGTNITSNNAVFTNASISSLVPVNLNASNVSTTNLNSTSIITTNISSQNTTITNETVQNSMILNLNAVNETISNSLITNLIATSDFKSLSSTNTVGSIVISTLGNILLNGGITNSSTITQTANSSGIILRSSSQQNSGGSWIELYDVNRFGGTMILGAGVSGTEFRNGSGGTIARLDYVGTSGTFRTSTVTCNNLINTNASVLNLSGTNITISGLISTSLSSGSINGTNSTITNIVLTNASTNNINVSNETVQNLIVSNGLKAIFNSNTVGTLYTTGGNVGINTTQPSFILDVNGQARIKNLLVGQATGGGDNIALGVDDSSGGVYRLGLVKKSGQGPTLAVSSTGNFIFQMANSNDVSTVSSNTYTTLATISSNGNLSLNSGVTQSSIITQTANSSGITLNTFSGSAGGGSWIELYDRNMAGGIMVLGAGSNGFDFRGSTGNVAGLRISGSTGSFNVQNSSCANLIATNASISNLTVTTILSSPTFQSGTWTPVCNVPGLTPTFSVQDGRWTKFGDQISIYANISVGFTGTQTSTANVNLPFASETSRVYGWSETYYANTAVTTVGSHFTIVTQGGSTQASLVTDTTLTQFNIGNSSLVRYNMIYLWQ